MKPFAEQIDYAPLFAQLAERGILFSDEDKKRFQAICAAELKAFDGSSFVTNNMGGTLSNFVNVLFAFLQNIIHGFDMDNIGTSFTNAANLADDKNTLAALQRATTRIYVAFKGEGGKFADAAELVSGQAQGHMPDNMPYSIYNQIRDDIPLPFGTQASLTRTQERG